LIDSAKGLTHTHKHTRCIFNMKAAICLFGVVGTLSPIHAKLADRSRVVQQRQEKGIYDRYQDNGRPIEGQAYRSKRRDAESDTARRQNNKSRLLPQSKPAPWQLDIPQEPEVVLDERDGRLLSSQLSGCCYNYQKYSASDLCAIYGNDCESGETPSHDSGDQGCSQQGLSFIGVSFSVNTASGNPYSYQLCDQFPMENIIDRDYEYVMSMDEDGWLVGGGYKTFDYSGKMP
jgi:hypothetical protein